MSVVIEHECIEFVDIYSDLAQPTYVRRSSSGRYRLFFLAAIDTLCNIYHRVLPTDKI